MLRAFWEKEEKLALGFGVKIKLIAINLCYNPYFNVWVFLF